MSQDTKKTALTWHQTAETHWVANAGVYLLVVERDGDVYRQANGKHSSLLDAQLAGEASARASAAAVVAMLAEGAQTGQTIPVVIIATGSVERLAADTTVSAASLAREYPDRWVLSGRREDLPNPLRLPDGRKARLESWEEEALRLRRELAEARALLAPVQEAAREWIDGTGCTGQPPETIAWCMVDDLDREGPRKAAVLAKALATVGVDVAPIFAAYAAKEGR